MITKDTSKSILITQCLQNDFVKPLKRFEPLPNLLHVGQEEALRLLGENPEEGPISKTMKWAYDHDEKTLEIIHIRDWHDPSDHFQTEHLRQFGNHCIQNTEGADFAFDVPQKRKTKIVNASGLNDFINTDLEKHLSIYKNKPIKVGIIGVWTEAKITFLAYDLRTRFPDMQIAVCSALTASSSRAHHFSALKQLKSILGVHVFHSIGEFTNFLVNDSEIPVFLPLPTHNDTPEIVFENIEVVDKTAYDLIRYLFRDCSQVTLTELSGGFSGNLVFSAESTDINGHKQTPHVVKIGPQELIGKERTSFEKIERVLGNNAPQISDFGDLNKKGALKYRYAAMGEGKSKTFQQLYNSKISNKKINSYLNTIFKEQLGRLYKAGVFEACNLLDYYYFRPESADSVKTNIEALLGQKADTETLTLPTGHSFYNPYFFYAKELAQIKPFALGNAYFSYIHGDLNGANIIIDSHENVWLIDFFHTHRGHILKDLAKLENDLLYIFAKIDTEEELLEGIKLIDFLVRIKDLGAMLPETKKMEFQSPEIQRAYSTLRYLRSFYAELIKEDRNSIQLFIALLRYSIHTLSFDEPNKFQKLLALYASGVYSYEIKNRLKEKGTIRIDYFSSEIIKKGKLGLTILPGRKDLGHSLTKDIETIKNLGVTHIVTLVKDNEFHYYGVEDLIDCYHQAGFKVKRLPILDQKVPPFLKMKELVIWIDKNLEKGANIMIHCAGGLGRAGLTAGCYLTYKGFSPEEAIKQVRLIRSSRAIETMLQEKYVNDFAK